MFSPQTGSGTERPGSESACGILTPNSPESSLTRQTLSSPPALRRPDVAEHPAPGLSANEFLKSGVRLVPYERPCWDPICVFHGILIRAVFPLADHVLPSLMMQPKPSQRLACAIGPYGVTSHE